MARLPNCIWRLMREISLENLHLLPFWEHLRDSLFLSVTYSNKHTHTLTDPVRHNSHPITDLPLHCLPAIPFSPFHPLILILHPHLHSLTLLFPLTLSCSTAISLLHLAIKTSREVEEKIYSFFPTPTTLPPNDNHSGFLFFLFIHGLEIQSVQEGKGWN